MIQKAFQIYRIQKMRLNQIKTTAKDKKKEKDERQVY